VNARGFAIACVLGCASVASAQTGSSIPAATQRPGDFDPAAVTRPKKPAEPSGESPVVAPKSATAEAPKGGPRFQVQKLEIEGVTKLPPAVIADLRARVEGRTIDLAELTGLTVKIEEAYRKRGYFLARAAVPPQEVTSGTVKLVVSEGRYGAVLVEGNQHYTTKFIEKFFSPAVRGGLVRERPLLEALIQLNQLPDLAVQSVFTPGEKPGTTDVILRAHDDRPLHLTVDYNNFGSRLVGRNRVGLSLFAGRAFTEGDDLVLRIVEPFPNSRSDPFYQAAYTRPIGRKFDRVGALFASAQTRVSGADLDRLDIRGVADIVGFTFQRPLASRTDFQSSVNASVQYKDLRNFVLNDRPTSRDELRLVTFGYNASERAEDRRLIGSALLTQGLGTAFNGSPNGGPLASRAGAGNGFSKLGLDGSMIAQLSQKEYLIVRGSTQVASRPLPVAEQFAVGGPDSVRGFIQSEALGDDGFGLSAEYRRELLNHRARSLQGVAFVDHGQAMVHRPQPGERRSRELTGMGAGLRAAWGSSSSARLDVGFPVSPDRNTDRDEAVLYVQASHRH
jgi:hemolysin activation/secretion protein